LHLDFAAILRMQAKYTTGEIVNHCMLSHDMRPCSKLDFDQSGRKAAGDDYLIVTACVDRSCPFEAAQGAC
jgi:hypothetical protein